MPSLPGTRKNSRLIGNNRLSLKILLVFPLLLQILLAITLIFQILSPPSIGINRSLSLGIGLASIICAIASLVVAMRYVIKPIERVAKLAEAICRGDLRRSPQLYRILELNALAISIETMRQNLQDCNHLVAEKVAENIQDLIADKEAAQRANSAKSEFIANLSHELRTPLNAILGFGELMIQDPTTNDIHRQYLEIMRQSGEDLLHLVTELLDLSKIEAGHTNVSLTEFNLTELMNSIRLLLQQGAADKGLQLYFETSAVIPQYITADRGKLRQVIVNLVANAIKFTDTGQVTARVQIIPLNTPALTNRYDDIPEAEEITFLPPYNYRLNVTIEDTGFGIEKAEMETLFEPFVQAQAGKRSRQGSGLGLSIARQLLHLMGGNIFADSTPGKGSVFRFYIPVEIRS